MNGSRAQAGAGGDDGGEFIYSRRGDLLGGFAAAGWFLASMPFVGLLAVVGMAMAEVGARGDNWFVKQGLLVVVGLGVGAFGVVHVRRVRRRIVRDWWREVRATYARTPAGHATSASAAGTLGAESLVRGTVVSLGDHALVARRTCWTHMRPSGFVLRLFARLCYEERTTWRAFAIQTANHEILLVDATDLVLTNTELTFSDHHSDHILEVRHGDKIGVYGEWEPITVPDHWEHLIHLPYRGDVGARLLKASSSKVVVHGGRLQSGRGLVASAFRQIDARLSERE